VIEHDGDVIAKAILNLPEGFIDKPKVASMVFALTQGWQELEDAIYDVITKRWLDNATKGQLDTLGKLVGEPRYSRTDTQYQTAIRGRILTNRSQGTIEDLLRLIELMRPGVIYELDGGPASFTFRTDAVAHDLDAVVVPFLQDAAAAGVGVEILAPSSSANQLVLSDAQQGEISGTGEGLGSPTDANVGGHLSTTIRK
jgi:hypothetical protein